MSLLDLVINLFTWIFSLGVIYMIHRVVVAEESKVKLMGNLLAQTEKDVFLREIKELVSIYSTKVLPILSRERMFDEPSSEDENEYYNFFHYHVVTVLTEHFKTRSTSGVFAMATMGTVLLIGGISILMIDSPSSSLAMLLIALPLVLMILALPILFSRFFRASRQQLDLLVEVDSRFTDLIYADSE